jgi:hypothetical protein
LVADRAFIFRIRCRYAVPYLKDLNTGKFYGINVSLIVSKNLINLNLKKSVTSAENRGVR